MDEYVRLFQASPLGDDWWLYLGTIYLLILARVLPLVSGAPFLGGQIIPATSKMLFAMIMSLIFLPQAIWAMNSTPPTSWNLSLLFIKEIFIGVLLAWLVSFPYYVASSAGALIDHQRGASSLSVPDPSTKAQSSPIGNLLSQLLTVVFFMVGGPFFFFQGISNSFAVVPIDGFIPPIFWNQENPIWKLIFGFCNQVMEVALELAAPSLVTIFITDLFLGIINRLAPQVQVTFLGMPLKSVFGIVLLWLGWKVLMVYLAKESIGYTLKINSIIPALGG